MALLWSGLRSSFLGQESRLQNKPQQNQGLVAVLFVVWIVGGHDLMLLAALLGGSFVLWFCQIIFGIIFRDGLVAIN